MKKALILALFSSAFLLEGAKSVEKPVLYSKSNCIYCQKVFLSVKGLEQKVEIRDVNDPSARQELIKIGGKPQVPCLVINEVALYESDAIIEYFNSLESMK